MRDLELSLPDPRQGSRPADLRRRGGLLERRHRRRYTDVEAIAEIVERAGGRITFSESGGEITWWREAGDDKHSCFFELGEIFTVEHIPPMGAIIFECGRWNRETGTWNPDACGAVRNDRNGSSHVINVRPEDCERAYELFEWILLRRGEYGEPLRMM